MKLYSRLIQWILVEISPKNDTFWYMNRILGTLGLTHDLSWWLVGKPMVNFLFALMKLFSVSLTVLELWGEMCMPQSGFTGRSTFSTQIYLNRVILHQPFLASETLGYLMAKTASLCIPSFWHYAEVWRTDRRTDGQTWRMPPVVYTAHAKL